MRSFMLTRICKACGKRIERTGTDWGYWYGAEFVCSYRCMREMRRMDQVTEEQKKIVEELKGQGVPASKIAEKAGVNPQNVYDHFRNKKAKEEKEKQKEALKAVMDGRYTTGWMCPCCRMVWSPWTSACNCQRKGGADNDGQGKSDQGAAVLPGAD